jgi:hypothetical protein
LLAIHRERRSAGIAAKRRPEGSDPFNFAGPNGRLPLVAHEIHIKTVDGGVVYTNAFSYGRNEGDLWVQVGDDLDHSHTIYFACGYWQQYVVDPHGEDPLDLDLLFEGEDDEDYTEGEEEEYEEDEDEEDNAE